MWSRSGRSSRREDDPADQFFVLRAGQVALEIDSPTGPLLIETIGPGQLVGWSWIFPPHRWVYDVEVLEEAHVIAIDVGLPARRSATPTRRSAIA